MQDILVDEEAKDMSQKACLPANFCSEISLFTQPFSHAYGMGNFSVCAVCVCAWCGNLMAGQASMKVLHKAHCPDVAVLNP